MLSAIDGCARNSPQAALDFLEKFDSDADRRSAEVAIFLGGRIIDISLIGPLHGGMVTGCAHSVCLLPGERMEVAASTGGDELLLFDQNRPGIDVAPRACFPLDVGHGICWDAKSSRLNVRWDGTAWTNPVQEESD